jgi:hypothetical protein
MLALLWTALWSRMTAAGSRWHGEPKLVRVQKKVRRD